MRDKSMLVRCPKCGFGTLGFADAILVICIKCGEYIRVHEVKTIGA